MFTATGFILLRLLSIVTLKNYFAGYWSSLQAKDTKVIPLGAHLLKIEAPAGPFHWMRSKPIAPNQKLSFL